MNSPVDHIRLRPLPWRERPWTYCGRAASDVKQWINLDDAIAKFKREGAQRAGYSMCQTCISKANRSVIWDSDPLADLTMSWKDRDQVNADLKAFAAQFTEAPVMDDELAQRRSSGPRIA